MAERLAGIQVHEEAGALQPIAEAPTAITAFVGRCLRGPVNHPVALGGFAWRAALLMARSAVRPAPKFGHGVAVTLHTVHGGVVLLGCYHPSQQNTFTGKLTAAMLDDVFRRAKSEAGSG